MHRSQFDLVQEFHHIDWTTEHPTCYKCAYIVVIVAYHMVELDGDALTTADF